MNLQKTVLYALGGRGNSDATKSVSCYDLETASWNLSPNELPFPRTNFGCVTIDKDIFIIGGSSDKRDMKICNDMFCLDTGNGRWKEYPPMKYRREGCGAACSADGKYIYVAGGWDGKKCWDVVERFSFEDRKWTTVKPMGAAKRDISLVELGGYLYALGGISGYLNDSVAERYDPETDQWSSIASMNHIFYTCGAAVLNGKIFVLGPSRFEMYSPEDDRWTELPASPHCTSSRRLVALNGELLAIGGIGIRLDDFDKNVMKKVGMPIVDSFDVGKRIWSRKPEMDVGRADPGLAVVSQMSNSLSQLLDNCLTF